MSILGQGALLLALCTLFLLHTARAELFRESENATAFASSIAFSTPSGIVFDSAHRKLYVADESASVVISLPFPLASGSADNSLCPQIHRFSQDALRSLQDMEETVLGAGILKQPGQMCVDIRGTLWVPDVYSGILYGWSEAHAAVSTKEPDYTFTGISRLAYVSENIQHSRRRRFKHRGLCLCFLQQRPRFSLGWNGLRSVSGERHGADKPWPNPAD